MKGIILLTGLFTFNALASFPQAWINPSAKFNKNEVSSQEKEFDKSFSLFSQNLDKSVEAIKSDDVSKNHWYLQSIKTEVGIEHVGKFGIVGAKGETAVELFGETKESKAMLRERHGIPSNSQKSVSEGSDITSDNEISAKILESSTGLMLGRRI